MNYAYWRVAWRIVRQARGRAVTSTPLFAAAIYAYNARRIYA